MPRRPLTIALVSRDSTAAKDGRLTNCYSEKAPDGPIVIKRCGCTTISSTGIGCAQAAVTYRNEALFIKGDSVYQNFVVTPSGATWTSGSSNPFSGARVGSAAVALGDYLYVIGGGNASGLFADVWRSSDGVTWTQITANGGFGARAFHVVLAFNSKLWIMGGYKASNGAGNQYTLPDDDVWSSTDGITWTLVTAAAGWAARGQFAGCVYNEQMVIAGGIDSTLFNDVWISTNGVTWTQQTAAAAWAARKGFGLVSHNGALILTAGSKGTPASDDDIWQSSNNGVTWTLVTATSGFGVRYHHSTLSFANRLWVAGGLNDAGTVKTDVWYSENNGLTWTQATASAWTSRAAMAAAVFSDTLFVYGGGTANISFGDVYPAVRSDVLFAADATAVAIVITPAPPRACLPFQIAVIPASGAIPSTIFLKNADVAYTFDGTAFTKVTDPDYPAATVYGVAYLDGTIYVMDSQGIIYGSDLAAPTSWDALNFISANAESDAGIAIASHLDNVIAFKEFSIQFFYDAANPTGSPLARMSGSLLKVGCASANSIAYNANTLFFMSRVKNQKGRSVMKFEGTTPSVISTPWVDRILEADDLDTVYAFCVGISGHSFYFLTLKSSEMTLCFDNTTGEWHTATKLISLGAVTVSSIAVQTDGSILVTMPTAHGKADGDPVVIAGATPSATNGAFNIRYDASVHSVTQFSYTPDTAVSGSITGTVTATLYRSSNYPAVYYAAGSTSDLAIDETTGAVYRLDPATYQDSGAPIDVHIRTEREDLGTSKDKSYASLAIVGDNVSSKLAVRYTNDDYATFSKYRLVDLSKRRPQLKQLGSASRRAWEMRHTGNTALRLQAMEPDIEGWN